MRYSSFSEWLFLLSMIFSSFIQVVPDDAHSLSLDFTVQLEPSPAQPWYEVQGSVDTNPFLQYDSESNKAKPLNLLGEKVEATKAWEELTQTLRESGPELRMILAVIELKENKTRGPLQAKLSCQREAEQCTGASWTFSFNGQTVFLFDTMNQNWTVIDPGARGIMEDWKKNKELVAYFWKTSVGDCSRWLGKFSEHLEKVLEPTVPPFQPSDIPSNGIDAWVCLGIISARLLLFCLGIILAFLGKSGYMKVRYCCPTTTSREPDVEAVRVAGDEELRAVPIGSLAEQIQGSEADPGFTRICGDPLLPKSSDPLNQYPKQGHVPGLWLDPQSATSCNPGVCP